MSLIGDDILGICKKNKVDCPVLSIEAGGLTGSFTHGYQQAMLELLKQTNLKKSTIISGNDYTICKTEY